MPNNCPTGAEVPISDENDERRREPWLPDPASPNYIEGWYTLLVQIIEGEEESGSYTPDVLKQHCPAEAVYPCNEQRSLLHAAVDRRDPQPALVQWLVDTAPSLVLHRQDALLPMDLLSSHILAKEERRRYPAANDVDASAAANWTCVEILARRSSLRYAAASSCTTTDQVPTLHACLAAQSSIPVFLLERALKRYRHQALQPDGDGNLPLHISLLVSSLQQASADNEDLDLVKQVFELAPEATRYVNAAGCLPLHLALVASGRWFGQATDQDEKVQQGRLLLALIRANPASLGLVSVVSSPRNYPFLLSEILHRCSPDGVFQVLLFGNSS